MLPLWVMLVTNGLLAVKIQVNNQVMALTRPTITLMDKISGRKKALVGALILAFIKGL